MSAITLCELVDMAIEGDSPIKDVLGEIDSLAENPFVQEMREDRLKYVQEFVKTIFTES